MEKRRIRRVAPVLHFQLPCGGSLAPDADAWALATSPLPPHVAPRRCYYPACWVARHAPKSLRSSAPSREPAPSCVGALQRPAYRSGPCLVALVQYGWGLLSCRMMAVSAAGLWS